MELIGDREPASENRPLTFLLLVVFLVILAYAITGAAVIEALQERTVRCYPIVPPLMQHEKVILEGDRFICSSELCRFVGRVLPENGMVCFFPPPQLIRSN